ncbi:SDR family oxidoreductase [Vibrio sp. 2026]|uniref:SDR family NAD(P)-dependent oxidoreductase n=1 Tax=unclassified Vibrio TaxID=2614977 RepID=UPI001B81A31E|nr:MULTISPECIES: SDR family oxidoreductase [unclassified Vibrio]MDG2627153.1 SDR family NAD(P)-dependent oxidoreductase [Vibrio parahaemolyticus]HBC3970660.1 SDR family oxidoreductase [Vibrio alginolyticus]MDW1515519.1 SDR family oxidoreductase [Vibrio sp. Vb5035]MDW1545606.1 SDR family oxidoreductase [Vibrio sp. Vb5034]MDW1777375.1 SDR family oxidoreductase [Vibrio sp. Vb2175]
MAKYILITGATSDIGKSVAKRLIESDCVPILIGRNIESLKKAIDELDNPNVRYYLFDNNELSDVKDLFKTIVNDIGAKLSGFIGCAGFHKIKPFRVTKEQDFKEMMQLNFVSQAMFAHCFAKSQFSHDGSSILFISSIASISGEPGLSAYSSSKAALNGLMRTLAVELAPRGITCNSILPGWVQTKHAEFVESTMSSEKFTELRASYPLGLGKPGDVASLCNFLISEESRWLTGQEIVLDGGKSLL